jgi:hypothetical protein
MLVSMSVSMTVPASMSMSMNFYIYMNMAWDIGVRYVMNMYMDIDMSERKTADIGCSIAPILGVARYWVGFHVYSNI